MKRFVRSTCFLLAIIMTIAIPANASESTNVRSSSFFLSSSVYLYKTSTTTFQAWFDVLGTGVMDKIGASEIKIQRSSDNSNWTTMKTYSMDDYTNMICENTGTHASYVTYAGTKGYYYRAYIKLYAKNESGSATWARYSSSIYLS